MKHVTYNIIKIFLFLFFLFFLALNIYYGQNISPLYPRIAAEDKKAVVSFLERISKTSFFPYFMNLNKNIYGPGLADEINIKEKIRKENIAKLETLLNKNPKSRDVLYDLYLLYKEDDNNDKATEYFNQAKEVDPNLVN